MANTGRRLSARPSCRSLMLNPFTVTAMLGIVFGPVLRTLISSFERDASFCLPGKLASTDTG